MSRIRMSRIRLYFNAVFDPGKLEQELQDLQQWYDYRDLPWQWGWSQGSPDRECEELQRLERRKLEGMLSYEQDLENEIEPELVEKLTLELTRRDLLKLEQLLQCRKQLLGFDWLKRNKGGQATIKCPPGFWLLRLTEFVCSDKTYDRTFEPTIGDIQRQYFEALHKKRIQKARWIRWVRLPWEFISAVVKEVGTPKVSKPSKVLYKIVTSDDDSEKANNTKPTKK